MKQSLPEHFINREAEILMPYIKECRCILDFGCGDLKMARYLSMSNPRLTITGLDIVPIKAPRMKRVVFRLYDGLRIPYPERSFDSVTAYHVFHHCDNPAFALRECLRVTRRTVVFVEPVLRSQLEKPGFMLMDYLANLWRREHIPMPFHAHAIGWWDALFDTLRVKVVEKKRVGVLPAILPIGTTMLFVIQRKGAKIPEV